MRSMVKRLQAQGRVRSSLALNISLGFLAGYVDAFGYITLFGLFTAHITGNFVLMGAEMATTGHTFPILKILALPAFVIGVALAKMIATQCERREGNPLLALYTTEMTLLLLFMLIGLATGPFDGGMSGSAIFASITGTMAMGVHGACGRLLLPDLAPTVMMTGNVTQLVIDFIELIHGRGGKKVRNRCAKYLWPMVAFLLGALSGAFACFRFGFHALLLPVLLLLLLGYAETRREKRAKRMAASTPQ